VDWNEDGLKDLIVGENNGKVRYFRNIGSVGNPQLTFDSYLQVNSIDIDVGDYSFPWINDWNEDGKKDLLVGESDGVVTLFINNGTDANPIFTSETSIRYPTGSTVDFGYRSGPNVVDVNGDGIKDLVSGDMSGNLYYCQNNGTNANPQLANMVPLQIGGTNILTAGTTRAAPIDWNNDGQIDFILGSYDARLKLYMQTATTQIMPTVVVERTSSYVVPVSGGTVSYNITITNSQPTPAVFDFWSDVQIPGYNWVGPLLNRPDVNINPSSAIHRSVDTYVPGTAPNGIYYYYGYVGNSETMQVYSSSSFYFYKYNLDSPGGYEGPWYSTGWDESEPQTSVVVTPESCTFISAAPNPFNPITGISFSLAEAGDVYLSVFDINGREVAQLADGYRSPGNYEITFDGSDLSSGVYFARLLTKDTQLTQKLLLVK